MAKGGRPADKLTSAFGPISDIKAKKRLDASRKHAPSLARRAGPVPPRGGMT